MIQEQFGVSRQSSKGNETVTKFTLTNRHGVKAQFITFGATLTNLFIPDRNGTFQDVLLGFDDLDGTSFSKLLLRNI